MSLRYIDRDEISRYQELLHNPYKMHHKEIKEDVKEVIFYVVSCMCDNKYTLRFKKHNGEFEMSGMGFALSNFQFSYKPFEIEWEADQENWIDVVDMINSGTVKVEKVISR